MKLTDRQKLVGLSLLSLLFIFTFTISFVTSRQNQSAKAQLEKNTQLDNVIKSAKTGSSTQGRNPKFRTASTRLAASPSPAAAAPGAETAEQIKMRVNPINIPVIEPIAPLNNEDIVNYLLGGTMGARASATDFNSTEFMLPGTRMPTAGPAEYDAAVAHIYYWQFKAHVAFSDVVFNFEQQDIMQDIANNIATGSAYVMKSREGDTLVRVASIYRGELCTSSVYNNPVMKEILIKWGRNDLAAEPGVGDTDIESIALVAQALDETPDPILRRQRFLELYSFDDNNNPMSPTGAVPSLRPYQCTIDILSDGSYNKLLENYVTGVKTQVFVQPTPGGFDPNGPYAFPKLGSSQSGMVTPTFGVIVGPSANPTLVVTSPTPVNVQPTTPATPVDTPKQPDTTNTNVLILILLLLASFFRFLFGLG